MIPVLKELSIDLASIGQAHANRYGRTYQLVEAKIENVTASAFPEFRVE